MKQVVLVGIGAGAAAALLFTSVATGSVFALVLFYLAPLPLLIAGIGWGNLASLIASALAMLSIGVMIDGHYIVVFAVSVALPALWLSHLSLLARPANDLTPNKLEWYPTGRIVLWAAVAAALGTLVITIVAFGLDYQNYHSQLSEFFARAEERLRGDNNLGPEKLFNPDLLARVMPAIGAGLSTLILLINTSLAGRIVRISGQLRRPWPDLPAMTFPRASLTALAFAFAGLLLPGLLTVIATVFAGALTMAFVVLGFAALHQMTRNVLGRWLILAVAYSVVIPFVWPAIFAALIGLVDTAFDLRKRAALAHAPPTPE